jgi:hypothetical protein
VTAQKHEAPQSEPSFDSGNSRNEAGLPDTTIISHLSITYTTNINQNQDDIQSPLQTLLQRGQSVLISSLAVRTMRGDVSETFRDR